MKKILLVHATAGAGHMKAAEAVYNKLKTNPDLDVKIIDSLDYTSPTFKELYRNAYSVMVSKFPWAWGFFFGLVDVPVLQPLVKTARRIYNSWNAGKLIQFLQDEQFDVIISTHFLGNEVAAAAKRLGLIKSKIICVVTDFDVHRIWLADGIDLYAVASVWTKRKIVEIGVPLEKVAVTGIPTDQKFSASKNISELKQKFGLKKDAFTALLATGSFGFGPIEEIINELKDSVQVLVVCGHNKTLYETLAPRASDSLKVFPLVNNMHELMAVSDVMVTKPGGLSISEALVSQLPMIFFNAIPGQETNNIDVLAQHQIGFSAKNVKEIVRELERLRSSKDDFLAAVKNTKALARPSAVDDVAALI